jgi:hypothetical protein
MATVNEFRQFADECLRWAADAESEEHRNAFLGMARAWTQAALRMEGVLIPDMDEQDVPPIVGAFGQ